MGSCVILHTHTALINAPGVLAVDVVLLLAMLIGLLRHRNSVGIWKLLYQQVTPDNLSVSRPILSSFQCIIWIVLALIAEIPVVVCPIPPLCDIQLTDSKVFLILNLNGVSLYFLFAQQCVEWD